MKQGLHRLGCALALIASTATSASAAKGTIRGTVEVASGHTLESVVIYVEGKSLAGSKADQDVHRSSMPPTVVQRNQEFFPEVLPVVRGSTVAFPNEDKVMHNVFSPTKGASFDLGHYASGFGKQVVFKKTGVVDIYCDIHPQMVATILVLENRFFAQPDEQGKFEILGVPEGNYTLVGWIAYGAASRVPISIRSGEPLVHRFVLPEANRSKSHVRKDGVPYGRYK